MWSPFTWLVVVGVIFLDFIGVFIHLYWRTHRDIIGKSGHPMAGKTGVVVKISSGPERKAKVKIEGVLWDAVSEECLQPGENIVVTGGEGITLRVVRNKD